MGTLRDFDLARFGCDVFFETGTGNGYSLSYALASGCFGALYSVEVDPEAFLRARDLFGVFPKLHLINSGSVAAMCEVLPTIPRWHRILFFLDAHFPGETSQSFAGYKADVPLSLRLPLEEELATIRDLRSGCKDAIVADDLRIYEDGPFASGNMPEWAETLSAEQKNTRFVQRIFPDRIIEKDYRSEGYLLISA